MRCNVLVAIVVGVCLGVCLKGVGFFSGSVSSAVKEPRSIKVHGQIVDFASAEYAVVSFFVRGSDRTLHGADEKCGLKMEKLTAKLAEDHVEIIRKVVSAKKSGESEDSFRINEGMRSTSYEVVRTVRLLLPPDVEEVQKVLEIIRPFRSKIKETSYHATQLIMYGLDAKPEYNAKISARCIKNARETARAIAATQGSKVGRVLSVDSYTFHGYKPSGRSTPWVGQKSEVRALVGDGPDSIKILRNMKVRFELLDLVEDGD